jgi:hypothetical protein
MTDLGNLLCGVRDGFFGSVCKQAVTDAGLCIHTGDSREVGDSVVCWNGTKSSSYGGAVRRRRW